MVVEDQIAKVAVSYAFVNIGAAVLLAGASLLTSYLALQLVAWIDRKISPGVR